MAQRPLLVMIGTAFAIGFAAIQLGSGLGSVFAPDEPSLARVDAGPRTAPSSTPAAAGQSPSLAVAADSQGQYLVHPGVDGLPVRMLVDTGASLVALRAEDARALGIKLAPSDYTIRLRTANGTVRGARVNLREVKLGAIVVRNVDAVVLPQGALGISLLGTSFLSKLRSYEVRGGRMVLSG